MDLIRRVFLSQLTMIIFLMIPLSMPILALIDAQPCSALWTESTIYIRADGRIDPPNAPIITADNITYTLTDDINVSDYGIIIERDNIVLDGAGHTLEGNYPSVRYEGIRIGSRSNVTVTNVVIKRFSEGISISWSSNISVSGNNITACYSGIYIYRSSGSIITDNALSNNEFGISLLQSSNNTIVRNNITENSNTGISLSDSSNNNTIAENNVRGNHFGIHLFRSSNNRVAENNITNNSEGIIVSGDSLGQSINNTIIENNAINNDKGIVLLNNSSNSSVIKNIIAHNSQGISIEISSGNYIIGNNVTTSREVGLRISESSNNVIAENNVAENNIYGYSLGIRLSLSSGNRIHHNNFINNSRQASTFNSTLNLWDDGYPSGGNYWSDYTGADLYSGPYQNMTGSDGLGDTPYIIDADNRDRYPLMKPYVEDKTPPSIIEIRRQPEGDIEPNQPVKILVNATDDLSGVKWVILSYCIGDSPSWTDIVMSFNATSGLYEGIIQVEQANVIVRYKVTVYDNAENQIVDDNNEQYYIYNVIPESPSTTILLTLVSLATVIIVLQKRVKLPEKRIRMKEIEPCATLSSYIHVYHR